MSADVINETFEFYSDEIFYFLCCCSCLVIEWHRKWRSLWSFRQLYMVFITIKNIGIQLNQTDCAHKKGNPYDYFAIKTCQKDGKIVGHLPMEISRPTKYLLERGARITATLTSTLYYASPLVQRGLKIPCLIKVYMPRTVKNKQIISMYEEVIEALYQEDGWPVIGSILNWSETTEPADIEWRGEKNT